MWRPGLVVCSEPESEIILTGSCVLPAKTAFVGGCEAMEMPSWTRVDNVRPEGWSSPRSGDPFDLVGCVSSGRCRHAEYPGRLGEDAVAVGVGSEVLYERQDAPDRGGDFALECALRAPPPMAARNSKI